jgi:hypothetical protein
MDRRRFSIAMVAVVLGGCSMIQRPQPAHKFSETLHSVRPADGEPPSGWILTMGMAGMQAPPMDLDVSAVKSQVQAPDGKNVQVMAENQPAPDRCWSWRASALSASETGG